jgi:hypothetical protein
MEKPSEISCILRFFGSTVSGCDSLGFLVVCSVFVMTGGVSIVGDSIIFFAFGVFSSPVLIFLIFLEGGSICSS